MPHAEREGVLMSYATLDELKAHLNIDLTDTSEDTKLQLALDAVTELIDEATSRTFAVAAEPASARFYTAASDRAVFIDDAVTITQVESPVGTVWDDALEYDAEPVNGPALGRPYEEIVSLGLAWSRVHNDVKITATWGWPATPKRVKQACLIQSARVFRRPDSPFGVAGSPELGNELRLLARLDPDVENLLATLRRVTVE